VRLARTVIVSDPLVRANVLTALVGPGAPAGILSCATDGETIEVTFESSRSAPELIDALIDIETVFVPARTTPIGDAAVAAAIAARGLDEPALDASCIIESYLT
jgi:hypothetical protein